MGVCVCWYILLVILVLVLIELNMLIVDVFQLNLNDIKRCVLLDYNPENKIINFRHL